MAESGLGGAQGLFAQNRAMRLHQRERSVIADRADVADVVGESLDLGRDGAKPMRAHRRLDPQRRFGRAREGDLVSDRAVAADARGERQTGFEARAAHQRADALVDIAQSLLEPDDRFTAGVETKMSGFDNSGVNRTDRDLMQPRSLRFQELITLGRGFVRPGGAERSAHRPATVIEPGAQIQGALRAQSREIGDRALQAVRRRMNRRDRRKLARRTSEPND